MKKTSLKALLGAGASALALGAVAPAHAADLDPAPAAKEYVEVCPNSGFRGAILLPGTGVCFKVGGYAKGDFIYTFGDQGGDFVGNETLLFSGQPGTRTGDRNRIHALQSRLNFDARANTDIGAARAFIEGDFFSASISSNETLTNSAPFRLRHAFAELGIDSLGGSLLIGQTWTNFGDLGSYANTLDFEGPDAQVFIRQAQVRWTQPLNESTTLSIAAENPEFAGSVSGEGNGLDAVPDFTLALKHRNSFGNFHFGAAFRVLDINNGANPASDAVDFQEVGPDGATILAAPAVAELSDDEAFGYSLQFAGTINVGEKDKFRFQVNYGDGAGRYIQEIPAAAVVDEDGDLETIQTLGVVASYQHFWSDKLQSNLVGGWFQILEESEAASGSVDNEVYTALNLIYSPRSNVNLGIEGLYINTDVIGLEEEDLFRLQTSLQFSF